MGKKLKLMLLGCGKLSGVIAKALESGLLPEYELVAALSGHNKEKAADFGNEYHCQVYDNVDDLLNLKPDYIVEAASVQAVKDNGEKILSSGSNLVLLSIGALADDSLCQRLKQAAIQGGARLFIASGAVGGFDILRTAVLMGPIKMSIISEKDPQVAANMPLETEGIEDITAKKTIFTGTARQAIEKLPSQMNVAIALALASAGPEKTDIEIQAVPGFEGDRYKIQLEGQQVKTDLNIYSRTSEVAGWSAVAVLRNIVSPVVF
ncbi:MAG TPA: DUF108 domain-containing protein [Ligilactobacillus acidipiscis]|uniref:L-aspartate dehydrogenase n=1 Tax=Ligilactobacillus acidipiscis TaxID=89059 RepID=A0A921K1J8_9LACO|nr:DUF108 domain-containing protein [Ligilactobacillus acidipiscis]